MQGHTIKTNVDIKKYKLNHRSKSYRTKYQQVSNPTFHIELTDMNIRTIRTVTAVYDTRWI